MPHSPRFLLYCTKIVTMRIQRIERLNPDAADVEARAFIREVERHFSHEGKTIYKARNEIKVIGRYNVKKFGVPNFFNRVVYASLRNPKAIRAYENALSLLRMGIPTPVPFGIVMLRTGWTLGESYLITEQLPLGRSMYEFGHTDHRADTKEVLQSFGRFTAMLHDKGVLHLDYSPGNILFDRNDDGTYSFALVDVNRLRFSSKPVSLSEGVRNMRRLWGDPPVLREIAFAYAEARHTDPNDVFSLLSKAHASFWKGRDTRWIHTPWNERDAKRVPMMSHSTVVEGVEIK